MLKGLVRTGLVDLRMSKLRGGLEHRTPRELRDIFKIDFMYPSDTEDLELPESSVNKLTEDQQKFFINSVRSFNMTFPENERISDFNGFQGKESVLGSHVEHFLRSLIVTAYTEGVYLFKGFKVVQSSGDAFGESPLVLSVIDAPRVIVRPVKQNTRVPPMEAAFCSGVFEMYSLYHAGKYWPVYNCITDLNNWLFLKYDGRHIYRSRRVYKLATHSTSILSLGIKFLDILDSKD